MGLVFVLSLLILDIVVISHILNSATTKTKMFLYTLLIIFLPIIGVSIYYFISYPYDRSKKSFVLKKHMATK